MIVSAAIVIIDVAGNRSLWKVSREEFVVAVVAALGMIVFGVLVGVLVAVVISVVVALYRIARPHDAVLGDYLDADGWVDVGAYPTASGSASNRPCQTIRVRRSGWCSISKASAPSM